MRSWFFPLFCFTIAFASFQPAQGQGHPDTILTQKRILTPIFQLEGFPLKPKHMLRIMENEPDAYREMQFARAHYIFGNILSCVGGIFFGYPIGVAVATAEFNEVMGATVVVGGGFVLLSTPFYAAYAIHARNAVNIYNRSISNQFKQSLTFTGNESKEIPDQLLDTYFYFTQSSKTGPEVCVFLDEEKVACLKKGNYFKLDLPVHRDRMRVKLLSEGVEYPVTLYSPEYETQVYLVKFNRKGN